MTRTPSPLDRVHRDHERVLREQLAKILAQTTERRLLSDRLQAAIDEELLVVGTSLLQLAPGPFTQEGADQRRDRLGLQRDRQGLTRESREESRASWQDVQQLETERRVVERDLTTTQQRTERLEDVVRDAR